MFDVSKHNCIIFFAVIAALWVTMSVIPFVCRSVGVPQISFKSINFVKKFSTIVYLIVTYLGVLTCSKIGYKSKDVQHRGTDVYY